MPRFFRDYLPQREKNLASLPPVGYNIFIIRV